MAYTRAALSGACCTSCAHGGSCASQPAAVAGTFDDDTFTINIASGAIAWYGLAKLDPKMDKWTKFGISLGVSMIARKIFGK